MKRINLNYKMLEVIKQLFREEIEEAYIEESALVVKNSKGSIITLRTLGLINEIQKGILYQTVERNLSYLPDYKRGEIKNKILKEGIKGYIEMAESLAVEIQSKLIKIKAPIIYSIDNIKKAILCCGFERAEEILEALYSENFEKACYLLEDSIETLNNTLGYKNRL